MHTMFGSIFTLACAKEWTMRFEGLSRNHQHQRHICRGKHLALALVEKRWCVVAGQDNALSVRLDASTAAARCALGCHRNRPGRDGALLGNLTALPSGLKGLHATGDRIGVGLIDAIQKEFA